MSRENTQKTGKWCSEYPLNTKGITPDDMTAISVKVNGTGMSISNIIVEHQPTAWEKIKISVGFEVPAFDYKNVYAPTGSYASLQVGHLIDYDIWGKVNEVFMPYIPGGMTVYGEVVGYCGDVMIKPGYDYGCKPGQWKFMPYRITVDDESGVTTEWNLVDVDNWTRGLVDMYPQLKNNVMFLNIIYHGRFSDLYPEEKMGRTWRAKLLKRMKEDKVLFKIGEPEPMCVNKVPREGIIIRVDDDATRRAWRLKQ